MIASFLQDSLADELARLFEDVRFDNTKGERVPLNIYKQFLPVRTAKDIPDTVTDVELEEGIFDAEAEIMPFPYILVRVETGEIKKIDGEQTVNISLIIGTVDNNPDNQGYKDILNIIHKIYERFSKHAILAGEYECLTPIEWALQEEESFPFFFGGMALTFETLPIIREDPYT